MKIKIVFILIALNLFLFCFVVYKLNYNHKENIQGHVSSEQLQSQVRSIEYASESQLFNPYFFVGKDTLNAVMYAGKFPILMCCFSVQSCSPCYETMLDVLANVFPDYKEREDIVFLSNDLEFRYKDSFRGKKIYSNASPNTLLIEKTGVPYFFFLDSDLKTDLVMYSDKSNPAMIEAYLMIIKERLIHKD